MINKDDVTFNVNDGFGANGEEELGEITVSYHLGETDDYGNCWLLVRDETNNKEIFSRNDVCNSNNFESSADLINEEIRKEIAEAVNIYLSEKG